MTCVQCYLSRRYDHFLMLAKKYVGDDLGGDLLNDLCIKWLDGNERIEALCERGEFGPYITRSLQISGFSASTPFFKKYRKDRRRAVDQWPLELLTRTEQDGEKNEIEIKNQLEGVFHILQEIRWIDAEIFKAYHLHEHSLKSLADATGISKNTIYKAVKTAQTYCEENRERIRGYSGSPDSGCGEGRGGESSGGGLRLQGTEGLAEQTVPLFPGDDREGQKDLGGCPGTSDEAEQVGLTGTGCRNRPVPADIPTPMEKDPLRPVRT